MKIAFVTHFRPSQLERCLYPEDAIRAQGVVGRFNSPVANLVPELLRLGHHVSIVCAESGACETVCFKGPGLEIYVVPHRDNMSISMWTVFRAERKKITAVLSEIQPDIVHGQWTHTGHSLAALDSGFPCVVTIHDAALTCAWFNKGRHPVNIFRQLLFLRDTFEVAKRARYAIGVSPYTINHFKKVFRFGGESFVVPNALSFGCVPQKRRREFNTVCPIFIDVAAWGNIKNTKTLLKAFSVVLNEIPEARLILHGNGLDENGLGHQWARRHGLERNVDFRGYADRNTMNCSFVEADVFVHLAYYETFCMAMAEAIGAGLPVIIGDRGGAPWVVGDSSAAIKVNPVSVGKVVESMLKLVDNYEQIHESLPELQTAMVERFAPARVADELIDAYTHIMDENCRGLKK